jgi:hypothetical protein
MLDSFEDFKKAVMVSIQDKVSARLQAERDRISNNLFASVAVVDTENTEETPEESQSNAEEC